MVLLLIYARRNNQKHDRRKGALQIPNVTRYISAQHALRERKAIVEIPLCRVTFHVENVTNYLLSIRSDYRDAQSSGNLLNISAALSAAKYGISGF